MGCLWPTSKKSTPPQRRIAQEHWARVNGVGQAATQSSSSSSSDSAEDHVTALPSEWAQIPASCRRYKFRELEKATDGWSEDRVVGEGGFGKVYRGRLADGIEVAIKRLDRRGMQGEKEFGMEVGMLCSLQHENIVTLRGICTEDDHRCTIFDFAPNGSLRGQLDLGFKGLTWAQRANVALGAARGLAYLHDEAEPPVVHRDFKTSNILVDEQFNAKVADFGLARRMQSRGGAGCHEPLPPECTVVMGTFGYVAPEYARTGTLNEKSDVYAFGVTLLELLTGAEVVDPKRPLANRNLVDWLYSKLHDIAQVQEVLDPALGEVSDAELATLCELAAACLQGDGAQRPRMCSAAELLAQICALHESAELHSAADRDASLEGHTPDTPPLTGRDRPTNRATPTSSGEGNVGNSTPFMATAAGGNQGGSPVAYRSLSHETTIVCLDNTSGRNDVRDPFAASFGRLPSPPPQQQGYAMSASPHALPTPASAAPAGGFRGGHGRTGSFSESLDILAAKLGLSGPIGPNGQPTLAGMSSQQAAARQQQQAQQAPRRQAEWTLEQAWQQVQQQPSRHAPQALSPRHRQPPPLLPTRGPNAGGNMATDDTMQNPLATGAPHQQPQHPVQDQASREYIHGMGANAGNAFVSSTTEWRRRNLLGTGPLAAGMQSNLASRPSQAPSGQPMLVNGTAAAAGAGPSNRLSPRASPRGQMVPPPQVRANPQLPQLPQIRANPQQLRANPQPTPLPPSSQPMAVAQPQRQPQQQRGGYNYLPVPQATHLQQQQQASPRLYNQPQAQQPRQQQSRNYYQQPPPQGLPPRTQQMVSGWAPQRPVAQAVAPPWLSRQQAAAAPPQPQPQGDPFAASAGLPPASGPAGANLFHSSEPCMLCGSAAREWHLAPCGHAIGCKPCVLRIARVGQCCPVCRVPATGMLHQRFVHASPLAPMPPPLQPVNRGSRGMY